MSVRIEGVNRTESRLKPGLIAKSATRRKALEATSMTALMQPAPRNDLQPGLTLVSVDIDALKMPKRLDRSFGPEDVAKVAVSISQFGLSVPVLIGKNNVVIDGVVVVEAARSLGLTGVLCVQADHLKPGEERALRLAINRIGRDRPYDLQELKLEFEELRIEKQNLMVLGFSNPEIDQIMMPPAQVEKAPPEPKVGEVATSRIGDLWHLGDHLLLCGDAKLVDDYARLMGEERARLALTDPPYGVAVGKVVKTRHRDFVEGGAEMDQAAFEQLIERAFTAIRDRLADGGMLMSFMDWKHASDLIVIGKKLGLEHLNLITWVKNQGGMGSLYRSQSEFVVVLKRPGEHKNNIQLGKLGRDRTNVWHVAGAGTRGTDARKMLAHHPTPKPVQMLADAIIDVTDAGDVVLDPFCGSGSTLIAAEQTGRRARLMELDPLYVDLIIRRWEAETGGTAVHENGDRFMAIREIRAAEMEARNA